MIAFHHTEYWPYELCYLVELMLLKSTDSQKQWTKRVYFYVVSIVPADGLPSQ